MILGLPIDEPQILYNNLNLDIYISGQATEGESILMLLKSDDVIVHSMLIDSFVGEKEYNPLLDIIESNSLKNLNALVWTHPHEDHTKGMKEIIEKYTFQEIIVPINLIGNEREYRSITKDIYDVINCINKKSRTTTVTQTSSNHYILNNKIIKCINSSSYRFDIISISPISHLARKRVLEGHFENMNDFSISFYYCIGDFAVYLGGDVENTTIDLLLNNNKINNICSIMCIPNILKLPHHGSERTDSLIKFYKTRHINEKKAINIAAVTSYSSKSLPRSEIVKAYKEFSECIYRIQPNSPLHALLHIHVDLENRDITISENNNFINCY